MSAPNPDFDALFADDPALAPAPATMPLSHNPAVLIGVSEAAKLAGRDRRTIQRAMNSHRLLFTTGPDGANRVDPAELFRVFPPAAPHPTPHAAPHPTPHPTPHPAEQARIAELEAEIAARKAQISSNNQTIDELRRQLEWLQTQVAGLLHAACGAAPNAAPKAAPRRKAKPSPPSPPLLLPPHTPLITTPPTPPSPGSDSLKGIRESAPKIDLKQTVFGMGLDWLAHSAGKSPERLRSLLGRWCRDYGDASVLDAIAAAQTHNPIEPFPWIEQRLAANRRAKSSSGIIGGYVPMHPGAGG